jgi:hypothetical protein
MADNSADNSSADNSAKNSNEPERPRVEPEIIPPDRRGPNDRGASWPPPYGFTQMRGAHRVYVSRIGPFGFALIMLVVGLLAAVMLLILIGAALLWIPVVAVLVIIAAISGVFRRL